MSNDLSFLAYWRRAIHEAIVEATSAFGRPIEIYTAAVLAIAVVIVARLSNREILDRVDALIVSIQSIIYVGCGWFVIALIRAPWRLYRSQETATAKLVNERDALVERRKPKLAFVSDECCALWDATKSHHMRIGVRNISDVAVTRATAYLNYLDGRRLRLLLNLAGGTDPKTLNPTNRHYHLSFYESDAPIRHELDTLDPTTGFAIRLSVGTHIAHVSVESANAPPIEASVTFTVVENEQKLTDLSVHPL